jgi:membrane protease YdiL (CAAX protease family)
MPQNAKSVVIRISAFFAGLGVSGLALCALLIVLRLGQARFADLPDEATGSPGIALAYFGAASLTAAMVEEAAFRGYMFSGLRRAWGGSAAFLVVALLFSASHAGNPASLQLLPLYFLLSLGLTAVVALSGSLWPGVVAHALADFASYLLLLFWGREALTAPLDLGPPDEALVAIVLTALITTALSVFGFLALVRMRRRNLARRD